MRPGDLGTIVRSTPGALGRPRQACSCSTGLSTRPMKMYMLSIAHKARQRWTLDVATCRRNERRSDWMELQYLILEPHVLDRPVSSLGGILPAAPFHAAAAFGELKKLRLDKANACTQTPLRTFWPV